MIAVHCFGFFEHKSMTWSFFEDFWGFLRVCFQCDKDVL